MSRWAGSRGLWGAAQQARLYAGLLGLLCAVLAPATVAAEALRVVSWNVENYNVIDRMTPEGFRPDYPKPEAEKAALRAVVRALQPDILALQEIGGEPFVRELQRDLARLGWEMPHRAAMLSPGDRQRGLAVLAREPFAFDAVHAHEDLSIRLDRDTLPVSRGLLEVVFAGDDGLWRLFVVHLKSRRTVRSDDPQAERQRLGEAQAIRQRIAARAGALGRYLVVGDFNAGPASAPLRRFLRQGDRVLAVPLEAADSRGEVWTHYWASGGSYSRVDYVLLGGDWSRAGRSWRGWIADMPKVLHASDHRPVIADRTLSAPGARAD